MYLPSRLQKYWVTGRVLSFVIGLAASKGSSVRLTQTLRVPLNGLTKAMNFPSGEIWAPEISGSPKNSSRSIIGGCACGVCPKAERGLAAPAKPTQRTANTNTSDLRRKLVIEPLS